MGNGAVPLYPVEDEVSGVIKLDLKHLWKAHERHVNDDAAFRTETWGRVGRLEHFKSMIIGGVAVISVLSATASWLALRHVKLELREFITEQSKVDREYLDAKFKFYERELERRENSYRPEDVPQAEPVRRRR